MIPDGSPLSGAPGLRTAIELLRERAAAEPGRWQTTRTRRFGMHLAWRHAPAESPPDRLRLLREYVRPNSDDLLAVAGALPPELQIERAGALETEKVPVLHRVVVELRLRTGAPAAAGTACTRCGRLAGPATPMIGDERICALCATAPPGAPGSAP